MNGRQTLSISIQITNLITRIFIAPSTVLTPVTGKALSKSRFLIQDKIMATGWFYKTFKKIKREIQVP